MNTLIDTKIKIFREKFMFNDMAEGRIIQKQPIDKLEDFLRSSLQDIEKQTREEEAKAYAKGIAVICEKHPSLATEIKAILYDELKEKK